VKTRITGQVVPAPRPTRTVIPILTATRTALDQLVMSVYMIIVCILSYCHISIPNRRMHYNNNNNKSGKRRRRQ